MANHKEINEQVIVITGASSGIGLCTALIELKWKKSHKKQSPNLDESILG